MRSYYIPSRGIEVEFSDKVPWKERVEVLWNLDGRRFPLWLFKVLHVVAVVAQYGDVVLVSIIFRRNL